MKVWILFLGRWKILAGKPGGTPGGQGGPNGALGLWAGGGVKKRRWGRGDQAFWGGNPNPKAGGGSKPFSKRVPRKGRNNGAQIPHTNKNINDRGIFCWGGVMVPGGGPHPAQGGGGAPQVNFSKGSGARPPIAAGPKKKKPQPVDPKKKNPGGSLEKKISVGTRI